MEKTQKNKQVLNMERGKEPITWAEVKGFKFEDDDIICAGYQDPEHFSPTHRTKVSTISLLHDLC